ncbi:MAG: SigE family RNA polymerase sigma factor [Marmoricola sp.]
MAGPSTADEAVTQLYTGQYARLVRAAVLLLHDQEGAEDVVQDAFCDLHRRWSRLREPERAAAYLHKAVLNRSRSALRHRGVAGRHQQQPSGATPGADIALLEAERREAVLDALAALPRRQREVLVLRHYLDLSEDQIAHTLGISRGAVKSHAARAATALRGRLADQR